MKQIAGNAGLENQQLRGKRCDHVDTNCTSIMVYTNDMAALKSLHPVSTAAEKLPGRFASAGGANPGIPKPRLRRPMTATLS